MKKVGIRLLLSLIILTTVVVIAATPVSAAKPVRLGITITDISEGSITVDYWWNKIGARYYMIGVYNSTSGSSLNHTGVLSLGGRTPSQSGSVTLTSPEITCNRTYRAIIWLLRKPTSTIRGAIAYAYEFFDCPLPFVEDFSGVPSYSLPEGWVTNNSSVIYVEPYDNVNGTVPELCVDWAPGESITYDYWVRTPAINATATTTTLNLTFKHTLWVYNWTESFTYSVEVSNNNGSSWTAVLEETPTEAQYPSMKIGPETVNIDLSAYVGDDILIRWRLREYTYYSDGWYIDDVCVDGS